MKLNHQQIIDAYRNISFSVAIKATLDTPMAGGIAADKEGVEQFVKHQLHLDGELAEQAVARIMKEEIADTTPPLGEVETAKVYQVKTIRKDEHGPFIMSHMVQAALKQAASRAGIHVARRGSKGDMSEGGRVEATGSSLKSHWTHIYLFNPDGTPATTEFRRVSGTVSNASGKMSIVTEVEFVPSGCWFECVTYLQRGKMVADDVTKMLGLYANIGQGSCKAFGSGKLLLEAEFDEKDMRRKGDKDAE